MNILITGGASGLGEAITKRLASDTANKVYFTYYRSADEAMQLERVFPNVKGIPCNFLDDSNMDALISAIPSLDIQVLINSATTGFEQKHFHKLQADIFLNSFQNNILPVIKITQAAILQFRKQKFGKIITILSAAIVNKPPIGWSEYVANKAYLHSLSKSWAAENAGFNITSNCISPAFMRTRLTSDTDDRVIEDMIEKHPLKALLTVEEVAESVSFFVSGSQQINGTNLLINSGTNVI